MVDTKVVNYGPLTGLIGTWSGDKGTDVAPEPDGTENNNYYESIIFTEASEVTNAESEVLSALHYVQKVHRIEGDKMIHHETGYWMWNQQTNEVIHSLTIPRGVCVLAAGKVNELDSINFEVSAEIDSQDCTLIQSPFMKKNAKLTSYQQQLILSENSLYYKQTMILDIYGKVFEHTDNNTLLRQ